MFKLPKKREYFSPRRKLLGQTLAMQAGCHEIDEAQSALRLDGANLRQSAAADKFRISDLHQDTPSPFAVRICAGVIVIAYYRLYFRDATGSFLRVQELETDSDDAALDAARAIDHAYSIEVWQQRRQVAIVFPRDKPDKA